jgi:hypothetical protein
LFDALEELIVYHRADAGSRHNVRFRGRQQPGERPAWAQPCLADPGRGLLDPEVKEPDRTPHLHALSQGEGVFDINALIANGALNLRVAEQDLHDA